MGYNFSLASGQFQKIDGANFKSGIYFKNKDLTYNPESFSAKPAW